MIHTNFCKCFSCRLKSITFSEAVGIFFAASVVGWGAYLLYVGLL